MSLTVGLCIPKGKRTRMRLPERIESLCKQHNINLVIIDMNKEVESQGPFDVLLHKVLDFYNECEREEAEKKIKHLISYSARHLNMVVIDNFKWCMALTNRRLMADLIKSCEFMSNGIKVFLPKTLDVTKYLSTSDIMTKMEQRGMNFPLIYKSYSAYFGGNPHEMALIFSPEHLDDLTKPCLLQEFNNHGGILYKVFAVGKKFNICERPSIKNYYSGADSCKNTIRFDSFRVSKSGQSYIEGIHDCDPAHRRWRNCDEVKELLNRQVVEQIISRIFETTNLYLFGFDVLIEEMSGNYALIDINWFPSYAGIGEEHFPKHLVELFRNGGADASRN